MRKWEQVMSLLPWAFTSFLDVLVPLRIALITLFSFESVQKWVFISLLWIVLTLCLLALLCGEAWEVSLQSYM